ncbi:hypothetical protein HYFRA_00005829 [Hymenoscyphus fraxineus]|uniref:Ecp2 effector protein domain-containing protein n=1 Tax=Hymenoscyphus fraxineus TaxID=746836 RepID=A0A9N9KUM2_9HELO|nr:hypothetical protein HYFRA_00005829 [Hymenoscyphus fraxineus]
MHLLLFLTLLSWATQVFSTPASNGLNDLQSSSPSVSSPRVTSENLGLDLQSRSQPHQVNLTCCSDYDPEYWVSLWASAPAADFGAILDELLDPANEQVTVTAQPQKCRVISCRNYAVATFCNDNDDEYTIHKKELAPLIGAIKDGCGKAAKGFCGVLFALVDERKFHIQTVGWAHDCSLRPPRDDYSA